MQLTTLVTIQRITLVIIQLTTLVTIQLTTLVTIQLTNLATIQLCLFTLGVTKVSRAITNQPITRESGCRRDKGSDDRSKS